MWTNDKNLLLTSTNGKQDKPQELLYAINEWTAQQGGEQNKKRIIDLRVFVYEGADLN